MVISGLAFNDKEPATKKPKRAHGQRGEDEAARAPKKCKLCRDYGGRYPLACKGRTDHSKCDKYAAWEADGKPKLK